ncbi:MAG TPA: dihydrolipoamide acetyltransferase family protein [Candidatus Saccharimonadales bacterium]|nr:dihydrolipoamide acetyltransferase family protein [Candidatus Saccharimonadales bacterium]
MLTIRDFLMPDLGEGLTEGEINRWLVAEGDVVVVDQPIAEITTEKAVVEVPTPFAGRVATLHGAEGETITVGKPLISIEVAAAPTASPSGNVLVGYGTSESAPRSRRAAASVRVAVPAPTPTAAMRPASPLVRRRAAELGIDLSTVAGSGPGGIVTQADLERAPGREGVPAPSTTPPTVAGGKRTTLTGVDRISAERLTRSHHEVPTAAAWLSADATRLMAIRSELEASTASRVTPFALILYLCARALQRFPRLNAHFDTRSNEIVAFDSIHLGVAVQTDRGLVVAVIRDAQRRSPTELSSDLSRLATAARSGSIAVADLRGSTFTVSNFGAFGVDGGTAIINPPEAAILGVGRIATRPWVVDSAVVPRSIVELSLVFDHRVADGGVAGGFIRHLADLIEAPDEALA